VRIVIGSDHAGYPLKEELVPLLIDAGHEVYDVGTTSTDPVDYPDYAEATALALLQGRGDRAIVVCGSGAGACIAANKVRGIRCFQGNDTYTAHQAVEHDDANMIALAARVTGGALAYEVAEAFLGARFWDEGRYRVRLDKVLAIEDRNFRTDVDPTDRR
jgi:RpiB/LacA/LacB family sugar-phosphate isomerase